VNVVIIKPNAFSYSETFIEAHLRRLPGRILTLYGGHFPAYTSDGRTLLRNPFLIAWYLFAKRVLGQKEIGVRTRALASYLKKQQTDVVLAEYGVTGALVCEACQSAHVPLVIHFHGFDASDKSVLKAYGGLYLKAFAYASQIIAVSALMERKLVDLGAPPEKVVYLNYGVDIDLFKPGRPSDHPSVFLSVARFAEKKAPHITIMAFKDVLSEVPHAKLIMAGDGPIWESAKQLVTRLGLDDAVSFMGTQNPAQVAALMRTAAIFVQHSVEASSGDSEGTPNSILEASASALPVVSTRHAGITEAVIHGLTGFLGAEKNVDEMAAFMKRLAKDPRLCDELGAAGRKHMIHNYNQTVQIGKLDAALTEAHKAHTAYGNRE